MKKRNITMMAILVVLLIAGGVWYGMTKKAEAPSETKNVATSTEGMKASSTRETESVATGTNATSSVPMTISMENWKKFDGEKVGLKRGITFLYPEKWDNKRASVCGGSGCGSYFFLHDRQEIQENLVLYFGIHSEEAEHIYTIKKVFVTSSLTINGYQATLKHQIAASYGKRSREWALVIHNVEGSVGSHNRYEFHMKDIYTNSEEVFMKIIQSIQIEPYEEFKKKL